MKDIYQTSDPYPGSVTSAEEILDLASAYCEAAKTLFDAAHKGSAVSYAPARLCAIHATELFLNAFLRQQGVCPSQIRGRLHNLEVCEFQQVLQLRKKTARHLKDMTDRREYLISRYAPDLMSQLTEINRLTATLTEIQMKVTRILRP